MIYLRHYWAIGRECGEILVDVVIAVWGILADMWHQEPSDFNNWRQS